MAIFLLLLFLPGIIFVFLLELLPSLLRFLVVGIMTVFLLSECENSAKPTLDLCFDEAVIEPSFSLDDSVQNAFGGSALGGDCNGSADFSDLIPYIIGIGFLIFFIIYNATFKVSKEPKKGGGKRVNLPSVFDADGPKELKKGRGKRGD